MDEIIVYNVFMNVNFRNFRHGYYGKRGSGHARMTVSEILLKKRMATGIQLNIHMTTETGS